MHFLLPFGWLLLVACLGSLVSAMLAKEESNAKTGLAAGLLLLLAGALCIAVGRGVF